MPAMSVSARSLAALVAIAVLDAGCKSDDSTPDAAADGFDRNALLDNLARNVYLPRVLAFETEAAALPAALNAYCTALDAGPAGATQVARTAWARAVDHWQALDATLVGPAVMDDRVLRDRIYAWPLIGPCQLDRDTASRWANPASYDISAALPNARSLLAIELLLFSTATAHSCLSAPAGWDALGADLPRARCRLAEAIASDVATQAATLATAWRSEGGDYVGTLANAGRAGSPFSTAQAAINEVSDGLFYLDRMVKDMKIAEPAGIAINVCGAVDAPCDREVELRLADRATFAIRANLVAQRAVFTGGDGVGFDDFLRALGSPELADRMVASFDRSIALAAALPDSFLGALATDRAAVVATHAAVKSITDDLKTQFLTVLALEIPDDVATDND